MTDRYENLIVEVVSRAMVPFILLFGIYVISHGHYSPGGGFQGGVILATGVILLRLFLGAELSHRLFPTRLAMVLMSSGILVFFSTGLIPLALGGEFLNYQYMPLPGDSPAQIRYLAILIAETGIGLAVWGTLVTILDYLARSEE